jgi:hypothetical protein
MMGEKTKPVLSAKSGLTEILICSREQQEHSCPSLVRLTSTGQRDPDFGQDGIRLYPLTGGASLPSRLRKLHRHLYSVDIDTGPNGCPQQLILPCCVAPTLIALSP